MASGVSHQANGFLKSREQEIAAAKMENVNVRCSQGIGNLIQLTDLIRFRCRQNYSSKEERGRAVNLRLLEGPNRKKRTYRNNSFVFTKAASYRKPAEFNIKRATLNLPDGTRVRSPRTLGTCLFRSCCGIFNLSLEQKGLGQRLVQSCLGFGFFSESN